MPDVPSQPGVGASAVIRFGEALQLLERRIGLKNAEPLQPLFMHAYTAAHATVPETT